MTTDKNLENYLDWINEFYGKDIANTMLKDQNNKINNIFEPQSKLDIKENKKESKPIIKID